ncbi:mCG147506 [Mus musculus]|nr:mCG147506 [Mus musculus]
MGTSEWAEVAVLCRVLQHPVQVPECPVILPQLGQAGHPETQMRSVKGTQGKKLRVKSLDIVSLCWCLVPSLCRRHPHSGGPVMGRGKGLVSSCD